MYGIHWHKMVEMITGLDSFKGALEKFMEERFVKNGY